MANIIINYNAGTVIKVDGICYVFDAMTNEPLTPATVEGAYETCEECSTLPSSSSSSSSSSGTIGYIYLPCTPLSSSSSSMSLSSSRSSMSTSSQSSSSSSSFGASYPTVTLNYPLGGSANNFPEYATMSGYTDTGAFTSGIIWQWKTSIYREGPGDSGPGYEYISGPSDGHRYSSFWNYDGYDWYYYDSSTWNWYSLSYGMSVQLFNGIDGTDGFRLYGATFDITFTPTGVP
jgi:hypothetical protein